MKINLIAELSSFESVVNDKVWTAVLGYEMLGSSAAAQQYAVYCVEFVNFKKENSNAVEVNLFQEYQKDEDGDEYVLLYPDLIS